MSERIVNKFEDLREQLPDVILTKGIKIVNELRKYNDFINITDVYDNELKLDFVFNNYYVEIIINLLIYELYIERNNVEILTKGYYSYIDVVKHINDILG